MRLRNRVGFAFILALGLIACGTFGGLGDGQAIAKNRPETPPPPIIENVKLGDPYKVGSEMITPKDEINYDEVGYASWYGDELRGQNTGNGEVYNPDAVSAAHRTLPMPSYVEVTDLNSGRTILVRVNDRGPFAGDRILDLSAGAAKQLGVSGQGYFPVRVRRVNPPEYERNTLRDGGQATERLGTPPGLLNALRLKLRELPTPKGAESVKQAVAVKPVRPAPKPRPAPPAPPAGADFPPPDANPVPPAPKPVNDDRFIVEEARKPHWKGKPAAAPNPAPAPKQVPAPAPAADNGQWFVQIGAFSSEASARALAGKAGAQVASAGNIFRVRAGPYPSEGAARQALGGWQAKGYRGARVSR